MKLSLRHALGIFAFGSLVACMVPDVTKVSDDLGGASDDSKTATPSSADNASKSVPLQATPSSAVQPTTQPATSVKKDAGAPSGSSAQSGEDTPDGPTFSPVEADAGADNDDTAIPASCDKLLDCCIALRSAGNDTDADACDTSFDSNDDFTCFDAQYGYANPTDGTTGTCVQP